MKRRAREVPAPAVVDEAEVAHRYHWLTRWVQLTPVGEDIQLEHHGSLDQRVQHLEAELDRVGKRAEAEQFLQHLADGAERTRQHIADLRRGGFAA
jgi:hypothetical protein